MKPLDRQALNDYINASIVTFHQQRLAALEGLQLDKILKRKNPYLFRAKNLLSAGALISSIMDAFLSSSEEELFGNFLENLAIFVSEQTCDGRKSSAHGIDLEFDREDTRYLVSIKSSVNWGNSSQQRMLKQDFQIARKVQSQSQIKFRIQPVLGVCYGSSPTSDNGLFVRIVGQNFWYFLSGDPNLYIDIIEPIGHEAKRHNDDFNQKRAAIENRFTARFIERFCHRDGAIDWPRLVTFNSGNMNAN